MITIQQVKTRRQLKEFAAFPIKLFRGCPYYVPSLRSDEMSIMDEKKNFSLSQAEVRCFLCYKDGVLAGRIAGIIQHRYNELSGEKNIRFSRFECIDDIEVARALFDAVAAYGREKGMTKMHGPWGFNDQDREGMLTYGFDKRATYATNYNYEYFPGLIYEYGFTDESEWVEYAFDMPFERNPKFDGLAKVVTKRFGLKEIAETIPMKKIIREYGRKVFDVINAAYSVLDCYVPVEGRILDNVLDQFATIVNPRYMSLLCDPQGEVVGFAACLPSIADALIKSKGKLFPLGAFRILSAVNRPKELECAIVGVRPDYQGRGVNAVMLSRILNNIIDDGIGAVESNPELVTNTAVQSQWDGMRKTLIKRRKCFQINL